MAEVENIVLSLIEKEIPEGKKALQDGHENLDKVAVYCQQKYQEANNRYKGAPDKQKVREETREVFEETKQFATQSLASVAYQINTLAVNMLNLFDQQAFQLQTMESRINHISEVGDEFTCLKEHFSEQVELPLLCCELLIKLELIYGIWCQN